MKLITKEIKKSKNNLANMTFRLNKDLCIEFQTLARELGLTQATIIRNAVKQAIDEMKIAKDDR